MAAKKETADLDLDAGKSGGGKKMLVLYLIIGVLVLAVGALGTVFVLNMNKPAGDGHEAAAPAKHGDAVYIPLESMTVNFAQKGPARFLQVDMQVQGSKHLEAVLKKHMPAIRNDLLLLLGSQTFEEVSTREGKEKLRGQSLEIINRILAEQAKSPEKAEALLFTGFVMQ